VPEVETVFGILSRRKFNENYGEEWGPDHTINGKFEELSRRMRRISGTF
jgi:hypothetical protein